jgi:hypothetical protein
MHWLGDSASLNKKGDRKHGITENIRAKTAWISALYSIPAAGHKNKPGLESVWVLVAQLLPQQAADGICETRWKCNLVCKIRMVSDQFQPVALVT